jgi:hypothetical protein
MTTMMRIMSTTATRACQSTLSNRWCAFPSLRGPNPQTLTLCRTAAERRHPTGRERMGLPTL